MEILCNDENIFSARIGGKVQDRAKVLRRSLVIFTLFIIVYVLVSIYLNDWFLACIIPFIGLSILLLEMQFDTNSNTAPKILTVTIDKRRKNIRIWQTSKFGVRSPLRYIFKRTNCASGCDYKLKKSKVSILEINNFDKNNIRLLMQDWTEEDMPLISVSDNNIDYIILHRNDMSISGFCELLYKEIVEALK